MTLAGTMNELDVQNKWEENRKYTLKKPIKRPIKRPVERVATPDSPDNRGRSQAIPVEDRTEKNVYYVIFFTVFERERDVKVLQG